MIIKTKTAKTKDGGIREQIVSENKPGFKLRKKVTEAYQTKIKPAASEIKTKTSKSISEAAQDLKDMIIRK